MLPEDEVLVESWRLVEGGSSLKFTHIPTGVYVIGEPDENKPYLERLVELHQLLEQSVLEKKKTEADKKC